MGTLTTTTTAATTNSTTTTTAAAAAKLLLLLLLLLPLLLLLLIAYCSELLSPFIYLAMVVSGWNVTIFDLAFTSFNLNWTELPAVVNQSAKFYLVEIKSIQGTILAVETVPGNVISTVIEGLSPSTKYRVSVFGVDSIGQPYKSLETTITTTAGK